MLCLKRQDQSDAVNFSQESCNTQAFFPPASGLVSSCDLLTNFQGFPLLAHLSARINWWTAEKVGQVSPRSMLHAPCFVLQVANILFRLAVIVSA